jgi:SNF2 family DNA or RNA helicase
MFGPWELKPLVLQVPAPTEEETPPHLVSIRARCQSKPFQVPASIARYLGKYQQEGIQFMFRTVFQHSGGILGDGTLEKRARQRFYRTDSNAVILLDMGTGKTVQVLGLLAALLEKTGNQLDWVELQRRQKIAYNATRQLQLAREEALQQGQMYEENKLEVVQQQLPDWAPILILAPSSILDNWIHDAKTWGYFEIVLYQSSDSYAGVDAIRSGAAEVLLVSHTVLQNANHIHTLSQIPWKLVVIDEHHKLKNPDAKLPTNMRALRDNVEVPILGLTGTVMQNNHKGELTQSLPDERGCLFCGLTLFLELHCLIDLAAKDLFGDWDSFSNEFSEPIKLAR